MINEHDETLYPTKSKARAIMTRFSKMTIPGPKYNAHTEMLRYWSVYDQCWIKCDPDEVPTRELAAMSPADRMIVDEAITASEQRRPYITARQGDAPSQIIEQAIERSLRLGRTITIEVFDGDDSLARTIQNQLADESERIENGRYCGQDMDCGQWAVRIGIV